MSYFREKCRASEGGAGYKWHDWSEEVCVERIDDFLTTHLEDVPAEEHPIDEIHEMKQSACTEQDFHNFLNNHYAIEKVMGCNWMDDSPWDWGEIPPFRLLTHHEGIKLAVAQLKEEGVL